MRLVEQFGLIPLIEPGDKGASGADGESFSLEHAAHAAIVLGFGAITGDDVLKVYAGATAGAKTTELPFRYRVSGADAGAPASDQYGAEATVVAAAGLTLTAAAFDHRTVVVDVAAEDLPEGQPWVTVEIAGAATAQNVCGYAVLVGPRYAPPATAIATA